MKSKSETSSPSNPAQIIDNATITLCFTKTRLFSNLNSLAPPHSWLSARFSTTQPPYSLATNFDLHQPRRPRSLPNTSSPDPTMYFHWPLHPQPTEPKIVDTLAEILDTNDGHYSSGFEHFVTCCFVSVTRIKGRSTFHPTTSHSFPFLGSSLYCCLSLIFTSFFSVLFVSLSDFLFFLYSYFFFFFFTLFFTFHVYLVFFFYFFLIYFISNFTLSLCLSVSLFFSIFVCFSLLLFSLVFSSLYVSHAYLLSFFLSFLSHIFILFFHCRFHCLLFFSSFFIFYAYLYLLFSFFFHFICLSFSIVFLLFCVHCLPFFYHLPFFFSVFLSSIIFHFLFFLSLLP